MKLFILVARLLLGGLFFGHGAQKLFGWFGGYGPEGTGGFSSRSGSSPAASTPWPRAPPRWAAAPCSPPGWPRRRPRPRSPAS